MGNAIDDMIEEKLLNLNTAFIARVVSVQGTTKCSVQPLDKIKAYGKKAKSHGVITNVPILNHVRHYELYKEDLTVTVSDTFTGGGSATVDPNPHPNIPGLKRPQEQDGHLIVRPLKSGDLVLCVCAQRDIASAVKGVSAVPPVGHHQIGNAIVVGLLGKWPHEP